MQTGSVAEAGRCLAEAIPALREMRMRPALEHAERRQATANARTRSNYLVGLTARERDVTWGAACGDLARIAGETRHADGSRSSTAVAGGGSAVGAQARTPVNSRGMGASHAVISLGDLSRSSFDDEYFRSAGITWPEALCGARNPTPRGSPPCAP